jgi:hypothetical protein
MQYHSRDRTGGRVSTLALGAVNFGALGRTTATALLDPALRRRR